MREVDDQHAALRFQHASDLTCALLAHLAREVVKHQRAHTTSNCASGNGNASATAVLKATSIPALAAFEVARAIIAGTRRCRTPCRLPQPALWQQLSAFRSAPDIEHRFASCEMRRPISCSRNARVAPMCQEPDEKVIPAAQCRTRPSVAGGTSGDEIIAAVSVHLDQRP